MGVRRVGVFIGAIAAALLVGSTPAEAADQSPQVMTVVARDAILGINDNGAPGPTPGDIRTLSLTLFRKGKSVGHADIVQTLTRQNGDVGTAVKVIVLKLPRGTITAIGQTKFTNLVDPNARPINLLEDIAVVGGTGAFLGASGQVRITVLPKFASRWVISLAR